MISLFKLTELKIMARYALAVILYRVSSEPARVILMPIFLSARIVFDLFFGAILDAQMV